MIFNLFKTTEEKQYNLAIKLLDKAFKRAKIIVSLDGDQYPERMTHLAFEFNEYNNEALRILHELGLFASDSSEFEQKIFNKILPNLNIKNESSKVLGLIPKYVFTKKEYSKFEKIMMGK